MRKEVLSPESWVLSPKSQVSSPELRVLGTRALASGFRLQASLLRMFHFLDVSQDADAINNQARRLVPEACSLKPVAQRPRSLAPGPAIRPVGSAR